MTAPDPRANALAIIQAAMTRRAAAGLVATNGIHCPTPEWLAFHNARDAAPRDAYGRITLTDDLRALHLAAKRSTGRA